MGKLNLKLNLFKCEKCGRSLTSGRALSNHMHFHAQKARGLFKQYPPSCFSSPCEDEDSKGLADHDDLFPPQSLAPEECAAWNLVFLSRDSWDRGSGEAGPVVRRARTQHVCGTCGKGFRSYQALGGHRAGHAKANGSCPNPAS